MREVQIREINMPKGQRSSITQREMNFYDSLQRSVRNLKFEILLVNLLS